MTITHKFTIVRLCVIIPYDGEFAFLLGAGLEDFPRKLSKIGASMGEQTEKQGYSFGTFKGVYTPSVLTIFGVIMYLRFG